MAAAAARAFLHAVLPHRGARPARLVPRRELLWHRPPRRLHHRHRGRRPRHPPRRDAHLRDGALRALEAHPRPPPCQTAPARERQGERQRHGRERQRRCERQEQRARGRLVARPHHPRRAQEAAAQRDPLRRAGLVRGVLHRPVDFRPGASPSALNSVSHARSAPPWCGMPKPCYIEAHVSPRVRPGS